MSAVRVKIEPWFRRTLYLGLFISWVSGVLFFVMNNWITVTGDFGPEKHPWQFNVLLVHGAAAFIMLMLFGSILSNHIPMTWKTKRLRKIGITISSFIVIQAVTAYLLYYLANEDIRVIVSYLHLAMGGSLPLLLWAHIKLGRKR